MTRLMILLPCVAMLAACETAEVREAKWSALRDLARPLSMQIAGPNGSVHVIEVANPAAGQALAAASQPSEAMQWAQMITGGLIGVGNIWARVESADIAAQAGVAGARIAVDGQREMWSGIQGVVDAIPGPTDPVLIPTQVIGDPEVVQIPTQVIDQPVIVTGAE